MTAPDARERADRADRSPWQPGGVKPTAAVGPAPVHDLPGTLSLPRALALAGMVAGLIVLAPVAATYLSGADVALVGDDGPSGEPAASADSPPDGAPEGGSPLSATPAERTGLGFLTLDDGLQDAVSVLGPPDRREPDINGTVTHTWVLAAGSEFAVTADEQGITGLAARVPVDPPVRIGAHAGVVIGESTPAEIADRWGDDHDVTRHPGEDFVLRYIECVGPFPVVVKFDQDTAEPEVRWDDPVTSVFISYADAEPGTDGCPAL